MGKGLPSLAIALFKTLQSQSPVSSHSLSAPTVRARLWAEVSLRGVCENAEG